MAISPSFKRLRSLNEIRGGSSLSKNLNIAQTDLFDFLAAKSEAFEAELDSASKAYGTGPVLYIRVSLVML